MSTEVEVRETHVDASTNEQRRGQRIKQRLTRNALLRHNMLLFIANMATSAFSYLFHPITGHLLGPQGYGSIASLLALAAVLLIPTQFVANISTKFTADLAANGHFGQVNYLLRHATRYALLAGALMTAVFIGFSPVFSSFLRLPSVQPVMIISLGFALSFATPLNSGAIQGRQNFGWLAFLNFLVPFLRVITTVAVLLLGFGINGILLAGLFNGIVVYTLSFIPLRDILRVPQVRIPSLKPLFTYSVGATLSLGGSILLTTTDTLLAKHFLSPVQAGYYAALATIGRIVFYVGGSFVWVMFPKVATLKQQGRPYAIVFAWTIAAVFALSAAALLVLWLFPGQVITLIFRAPAAVARQVQWYGLAMLLLALATVFMYYFLSLGKMFFVPVLLSCCALQAIAIMIWHGSIAQITAAMVAAMAVLLGGMATLYVVDVARDSRGRNSNSVVQ